VADEWGRADSGGRVARAREREVGRASRAWRAGERGALGPESVQPGGRREIPFSFSFPISKSILLSPFL
jgi:hypothetical protein